MEVAGEERLTVGLAGEMIGAVEADGEVCRDEGVAGTGAGGGVEGGEVRWWVNVFRGYVWDGQE
jgi:ESCRT-II complex subunit VPS36